MLIVIKTLHLDILLTKSINKFRFWFTFGSAFIEMMIEYDIYFVIQASLFEFRVIMNIMNKV